MRLRHTLTLMLTAALCAALAPAPPASSAQGRRTVGLLLVNGKVFTADARGSIAEAVAVEGERIVAVGRDAEIEAQFTAARTVDLKGKLVTPGFNDAHIHFLQGGRALMLVNLNGAKSLAEAKQRVAARVGEVRPGVWILGRGWDHTLWGGEWPNRHDLDEVAPNNPVFLSRVDGHTNWANSLALQKAGITRATPDPKGGEIVRDAAGEPTGILKETAGGLVAQVIPEPTHEEMAEALTRALAEARRYGITSIQTNDVPSTEATPLYREFLKAGKLTVRVAEWQQFANSLADIKRERAEFAAFREDPFRLRLTALKGYVDGTLGSRTSAMLAPFSDDPHNSGIPRLAPEELTRMIVERAQAGFQIALHCIGDRANRMALDGFAEAAKQNPARLSDTDRLKILPLASLTNVPQAQQAATTKTESIQPISLRHRIEHAQVVAPSDFVRFRDLGVIASMQPSHAISDKRWAEDRLGEYRVMGAYSWHTMMAHGVHVPFGTDWPVEPINPYLGLYAAVTRQSTDGQPVGGWWPEERISIEDAIRNYTAEGAYASFEEHDKGQIAAGMLADLVVHTKDLLTVAPKEILQTEPELVVFGGRVIYERNK
ncbi:MAG: amidohydrolase [Acidobacteriota bacterium]|nr:amidohydrolase [Acidobacteriota bacterium]